MPPGVPARLVKLNSVVGMFNHAYLISPAFEFDNQFFQKRGFARTGITCQADYRNWLSHLILHYIYRVAHFYRPALQDPDKNPFPRHHTVTSLVVNGAVGMA